MSDTQGHDHNSSSSDEDSYGPPLPPHLLQKEEKAEGTITALPPVPAIIGPRLPAFISRKDLEEKAEEQAAKMKASKQDPVANSNTRPDSSDEDAAEEIIGPYLPDDPRSLLVPKAQLNKPKESTPTKREEWMLFCPKERSLAVGLGPRKFLGRTPDELVFEEDDGDDETGDKFLENARAGLADKSERERDEQMEEMMKKSGGETEQKESLLSIHRKRKAAEDAKSKGSKERKPFDRDTDLKISGLSKDDQEKYIKKSSELGTRFHGGRQKFL